MLMIQILLKTKEFLSLKWHTHFGKTVFYFVTFSYLRYFLQHKLCKQCVDWSEPENYSHYSITYYSFSVTLYHSLIKRKRSGRLGELFVTLGLLLSQQQGTTRGSFVSYMQKKLVSINDNEFSRGSKNRCLHDFVCYLQVTQYYYWVSLLFNCM